MRPLLAGVLLAAISAASAHAAPTLTADVGGDRRLAAHLAGLGVTLPADEVALVQGRIGNNRLRGAAEVGLYDSPSFGSGTAVGGGAQQVWGAVGGGNLPVAFTLTRVGDTLTFEMGGYEASITDPTVALITGLVFTTYGKESRHTSSSATLSGLTLDGAALGSVTDGTGKTGNGVLEGVNAGDFTLTGLASLDWTGNQPGKNKLGFEIAAFASPIAAAAVPVPEPASALLLLTGLAGVTAVRRRARTAP